MLKHLMIFVSEFAWLGEVDFWSVSTLWRGKKNDEALTQPPAPLAANLSPLLLFSLKQAAAEGRHFKSNLSLVLVFAPVHTLNHCSAWVRQARFEILKLYCAVKRAKKKSSGAKI